MRCIICLDTKNRFCNLCSVCRNCLICKDCYYTDKMKTMRNCFNCRSPFEIIQRKKNCNDVMYMLYYYRYFLLYITCFLVLPTYNCIHNFPEEKFLKNHNYIIQSKTFYIILTYYINLIILPYMFLYFSTTSNIIFYSVSFLNFFFTILYSVMDGREKSLLHVYYNILYIYTITFITLFLVLYSDISIRISQHLSIFLENTKIRLNRIKIQNEYVVRRNNSQISPLEEHYI